MADSTQTQIESTRTQISQQQSQIAQAQQAGQRAAESLRPSRTQLLSEGSGLQGFSSRQALKPSVAQVGAYMGQVSEAQTKSIQQAKEYETQVAQLAPEYALPEYKAAAAAAASMAVTSKVNETQDQIRAQKQYIQDLAKSGIDQKNLDRWNAANERLDALNQKLGTYQSSLKYPTDELIKGYYSGQIEYSAQRPIEMQIAAMERAEERRSQNKLQDAASQAALAKITTGPWGKAAQELNIAALNKGEVINWADPNALKQAQANVYLQQYGGGIQREILTDKPGTFSTTYQEALTKAAGGDKAFAQQQFKELSKSVTADYAAQQAAQKKYQDEIDAMAKRIATGTATAADMARITDNPQLQKGIQLTRIEELGPRQIPFSFNKEYLKQELIKVIPGVVSLGQQTVSPLSIASSVVIPFTSSVTSAAISEVPFLNKLGGYIGEAGIQKEAALSTLPTYSETYIPKTEAQIKEFDKSRQIQIQNPFLQSKTSEQLSTLLESFLKSKLDKGTATALIKTIGTPTYSKALEQLRSYKQTEKESVMASNLIKKMDTEMQNEIKRNIEEYSKKTGLTKSELQNALNSNSKDEKYQDFLLSTQNNLATIYSIGSQVAINAGLGNIDKATGELKLKPELLDQVKYVPYVYNARDIPIFKSITPWVAVTGALAKTFLEFELPFRGALAIGGKAYQLGEAGIKWGGEAISKIPIANVLKVGETGGVGARIGISGGEEITTLALRRGAGEIYDALTGRVIKVGRGITNLTGDLIKMTPKNILFGIKGGETITSTGLKSLKTTTGESLAKAGAKLGEITIPTLGKIKTAVTPAFSDLYTTIVEPLSTISKLGTTTIDYLGTTIPRYAGSAYEIGKSTLSSITPIAQDAWALTRASAEAAGKGLYGEAKLAARDFSGIFTPTVPYIRAAGEAVTPFFKGAGEIVGKAAGRLGEYWDPVLGTYVKVGQSVGLAGKRIIKIGGITKKATKQLAQAAGSVTKMAWEETFAPGVNAIGRGIKTTALVAKDLTPGLVKYGKEVAPQFALQSVLTVPYAIGKYGEYQQLKSELPGLGTSEQQAAKSSFWASTIGESAGIGLMFAPGYIEPLTRIKIVPRVIGPTKKQLTESILKKTVISKGQELVLTTRLRNYINQALSKTAPEFASKFKPLYEPSAFKIKSSDPEKIKQDIKMIRNILKLIKENKISKEEANRIVNSYVPLREIISPASERAIGKGFDVKTAKITDIKMKQKMPDGNIITVDLNKAYIDRLEQIKKAALKDKMGAKNLDYELTQLESFEDKAESYKFIKKYLENRLSSKDIKIKLIENTPESIKLKQAIEDIASRAVYQLKGLQENIYAIKPLYKTLPFKEEQIFIKTKQPSWLKKIKTLDVSPIIVKEKYAQDGSRIFSFSKTSRLSEGKFKKESGFDLKLENIGIGGHRYKPIGYAIEEEVKPSIWAHVSKSGKMQFYLPKSSDLTPQQIKEYLEYKMQTGQASGILEKLKTSEEIAHLGDEAKTQLTKRIGKTEVLKLGLEGQLPKGLSEADKIKAARKIMEDMQNFVESKKFISYKPSETQMIISEDVIFYGKSKEAIPRITKKFVGGKEITTTEIGEVVPRIQLGKVNVFGPEGIPRELPPANKPIKPFTPYKPYEPSFEELKMKEAEAFQQRTRIINTKQDLIKEFGKEKYNEAYTEANKDYNKAAEQLNDFKKANPELIRTEKSASGVIEVQGIVQTQRPTIGLLQSPEIKYIQTKSISLVAQVPKKVPQYMKSIGTGMAGIGIVSPAMVTAYQEPQISNQISFISPTMFQTTISTPKIMSSILVPQLKDQQVYAKETLTFDKTLVSPETKLGIIDLQLMKKYAVQELRYGQIDLLQMKMEPQQRWISEQRIYEDTRIMQEMKLGLQQKLSLKQKQQLKQRQKQRLQNRLIFRPARARITETRIPREPRRRIIPFPGLSIGNRRARAVKSRTREAGYEVLVRRRGKFVPLGVSAPKAEAQALGIREVLGGSAATFKIAPTKKEARSVGIRVTPGLLGLFRPGKKQGEIVQRERMRILSAGEKRQISYAGIESRAGKTRTKVGRKIKFI